MITLTLRQERIKEDIGWRNKRSISDGLKRREKYCLETILHQWPSKTLLSCNESPLKVQGKKKFVSVGSCKMRSETKEKKETQHTHRLPRVRA